MATFTKFEEIEAWKTAEAIVVQAYGLLKEGPGSDPAGFCFDHV
jgi:hypothetical protein